MAFSRLLGRIRAGLAPPRLADPESERIAASTHAMALWFAAATAALVLFDAILLPEPRLVHALQAGLLALLLGVVMLARRGRVRAAAALLVAVLLAAGTGAVVVSGRVGATLSSLYVLAILAAGLLLGGSAALAVAALSAIAGATLAFLEIEGRLAAWVAYSPWGSWSGQVMVFAASAVLLRDALGRLRLALGRAESSEAAARAVFEQASDGILIISREGHILDANARACGIVGLSREGVLARSVDDFLRGEEPEDSQRGLAELAPGAVRVRVRRVGRGDGSEAIVESSSAALSDGRLVAILRDVTASRREQALLEHLRTALDQLGEGIALFDAQDRVIYSNRAFSDLYVADVAVEPGVSADTLAVHPRARDALEDARRVIRLGRPFSARFELRLADGSRGFRHATFAPVRDRQGQAASVAILRDVTREVELEDSLIRSQKLEAVGRLAAGLAHDFNNLLTVLFSAAETLLDAGLPDKESRQATLEIRATAERARDITGQLLALGRQRQPRRQVVELNAVVAESSAMLRRLVRENVSVSLRLRSDTGNVEADPSELHQLLLNLAANARDAMPAGGELEIATASCAVTPSAPLLGLPPGPYVLLSVRDTGEGMAPATRARLFEPFFTTKEEGQGTGLGLVSVRAIVEQSGGAIEVESEPGRGTTMKLYLPRTARPAEPPAPAPEPAPGARPARILLVEDEDAVRATMLRSLVRSGHQVEVAHNGEEALRIGLSGPGFDLLITDIHMPGLDGPTLAQRLRKQRQELRVLFTSGYARDDRVDGAESGHTGFLPKPFAPRDLARKIGEMLAG